MLLYFYHCLLLVYNLQRICISAYLTYNGPIASNLCKCNRVWHTPSNQLICHNKILCHPFKNSPNHPMMMEMWNLSSRWDKNQCLLGEGPWVPIISLDVFTSRETWWNLFSKLHKSINPLQQEKFPCVSKIFFRISHF